MKKPCFATVCANISVRLLATAAIAALLGVADAHADTPWTPSNLVSGVALWLDGNDTNTLFLDTGATQTITNNGSIARWNDKSGNGRNFTQATSANRPTFATNSINGLGAATFDGANGYMSAGDTLDLYTSNLTVMACIKHANTNQSACIIAKSIFAAGSGRWGLYRVKDGSSFFTANSVQYYWFSSPDATSSGPLESNTGTRLEGSTWTRTNQYLWSDGTAVATNTFGNDANNHDNTNPLYIGAYPNSGGTGPQANSFLNGKIAEIFVAYTNLTTSDRQKVEGYLAWKWGMQANLPADHLYKSAAPVNDTTPPTVSTLNPADDATGVAVDANLTVTFNENVQKGASGNITVKKSADNSTVETIAVTSGNVTVNNATVTITRSVALAGNTGYYVQIDSGAIKDLAGNSFAGIADTTSWNFTTVSAPCATPTFSPPAGGYVGAQSVTISTLTADSTVFYTTDGSTPTSGSSHGTPGSSYATVSVPVPATMTLKAFATNAAASDSAVATAIYATVVTPTWTNIAGGSWPVAGNWTNGVVATGADVTADFSALSLPGDVTVTLDGERTIGHLRFDDQNATKHAWTLNTGSGGPLTLQVSSGTPVISNNVATTLGAVLAGTNGLFKAGSGALTNSGDNTLTGLFGAQAGTVAATVNWVGNGRANQQVQVGGYGSAALWTNTLGLVLGNGAAAVSNTFVVASQGVLRVNGGITIGTNGATYNSLVITNGGQAFSTAGSTIGNNATNNSVLVMGGGTGSISLWDIGAQSLTIGNGAATGNVLRIDGSGVAAGAVVTNASNVRVGASSGSRGNSLVFTNGAQMFVGAAATATYLGWDDNSNVLRIDGGTAASVYNGGGKSLIIGTANAGSSSYNLIRIGASGVMTNVGGAAGAGSYSFAVGWVGGSSMTAASNQLVVTDGGKLYTVGDLQVGNALYVAGTAVSNSVLIANTGLISVAGAVYIGAGQSGAKCAYNSLTITNGGQMFSTNVSYIGSSANSNTATIVGGSAGASLWNLGGQRLTVGSGATGNVLRIDGFGVAAGAVLTNGGLVVGYNGGSGNSVLLTNGAQAVLANSSYIGQAANGTYSVLSNTLTIANATYIGASNLFVVGWADSGGTAAYNQLVVGAGGVMTNVGYSSGSRERDFAVGVADSVGASTYAYSNQMVVTDGGKVFTLGNLTVGRIFDYAAGGVASSNSLWIANGGYVKAPGGFFLGADTTTSPWNLSGTATFNSLTISIGGQLITGGNSYIGLANTNSVMNNNTAFIGGTNALWNLNGANLTIGSAVGGATATGNVLTVSHGGVVTNVNILTVGTGAGTVSSNQLALQAGGQVYATSATNTGVLTVGIDDTATPACGRLSVSGALNINGATLNIVTNGSPIGSVYVIAAYDTRSGTFAAINGLPYGWVLDLNYNSGKAIALVPPPAPTLASLNPTNNATAVLVSSPLMATFSENISLTNGGVITITNLTAGTATNIVLPDSQVTTNGGPTLTITPVPNLAYSSTYAVLIGTNTVRDPLGLVPFAGIADTTTWRFITQDPPSTLAIANQAASGVTASSTVFNATLQTPGTNAEVFVYWGPADGTNNPAAWSNTAPVGTWTDVASTNISFATNGLAWDTRYYYTFLATNAATNVWASPSESCVTLRKASAVDRYWDGGTADITGDGNGASAGGAGTWDTTLKNWDVGAAPHAAWNNAYNDTAVFGGAAGGAVSLLGNVTVGGVRFDTAGYAISGANTLTFGTNGAIAANADVTIASAIAGGAAVAKTGAGTLTNSGDNTLTGLFSVQAGTVAATVNWVGNGRASQQVQVGGYGSSALWTNTLGLVLGNGAAAVSNTFMVASQGVLRVNGGIVVGTNGATFASLVITNGGQAFSTAGSTIGYNATSNSALITGGGNVSSLWNLGGQPLAVGSGTAIANGLTLNGAGVPNGAVVTNVGATNAVGLAIGGNNSGATAGIGNSLVLSNGARFFANTMTWVGQCGLSNSLTLAGGNANAVFDGGGKSLIVGIGGNGSGGGVGSFNQLHIGAGGMMTNVGGPRSDGFVSQLNFAVGWGYDRAANSNQLVVTDGGQLATVSNLDVGVVYGAQSGAGASGNSVLIANTGVVSVAGGVSVGVGNGTYSTTFNSLTITNGGQLYSKAASYIGNANGGTGVTNNTATIAGGSSLWHLGGQNLTVGGASATGNVLTVSSGGVVTNVGTLTVAATNALTLSAGGQVYATSATNTGVLTVGIDDTATPACGRLMASGALNISGATLNIVTNGLPAGPVYVIATYGSLTGTFAATHGLPARASIEYNYVWNSQNTIALITAAPGTVFKFR